MSGHVKSSIFSSSSKFETPHKSGKHNSLASYTKLSRVTQTSDFSKISESKEESRALNETTENKELAVEGDDYLRQKINKHKKKQSIYVSKLII